MFMTEVEPAARRKDGEAGKSQTGKSESAPVLDNSCAAMSTMLLRATVVNAVIRFTFYTTPRQNR
jgi:predicted secreted protein